MSQQPVWPSQYPQQPQYPQQSQSQGVSDLPDGANIREAGDQTPFFPSIPGDYAVHLLSVVRRNGHRGGDSFRIRCRVLESNQPSVMVGAEYMIYRKVGDTPIKRDMTSQMLCSIVHAAGFEKDTWQQNLGGMMNAGEDLAVRNLIIGVQMRPSSKLKEDGTPFVNPIFTRLA